MTYRRCFFLGPGFPRGLGVPSMAAAALLFAPGLGPGVLRGLPEAVTGTASRLASVPLAGVATSLGVSTGVGSTTWAGVSGGDDESLESEDLAAGSWGNLASFSGDSGRTTRRDLAGPAFVEDMAGGGGEVRTSSSGGGGDAQGRGRRRGGWWWMVWSGW